MVKSDSLIIRINPQLKEKARRQAEKEEKTLSEWVTDLIKFELIKQKKGQ